MKKMITCILFAIMVIMGANTIKTNAKTYEELIELGQNETPVESGRWVNLGEYDYYVPTGYKPEDVLTSSNGTDVGVFHFQFGIDNGIFLSGGELNENQTIINYKSSDSSELKVYDDGAWVSTIGMTARFFESSEPGLFSWENGPSRQAYFGLRRLATNLKPIIGKQFLEYKTTVSKVVTLEELYALTTVHDDLDGIIPNENIVIVNNDYEANRQVVGRHSIRISVTDSDGLTTTSSFIIVVEDDVKPIIIGPVMYDVSVKNQLNLTQFITENLTVHDNVDSNLAITVLNTEYNASNYQIPGKYNVTFVASDESGNSTEHMVTLNVKDDKGPTLVTPKSIIKDVNAILTADQTISFIRATDESPGEIKIEIIRDEYTGKGDKIGEYIIEYKATDALGNTTISSTTIKVMDLGYNVFIVKKMQIHMNKGTLLTKEDVSKIMVRSGITTVDSPTSMKFSDGYDVYSQNYENEGVYVVHVESTSQSGINTTHLIELHLNDAKNSGDVQLEPERISVFQMVINFFNVFISFIVLIFTKLWDFIVIIFNAIKSIFEPRFYK